MRKQKKQYKPLTKNEKILGFLLFGLCFAGLFLIVGLALASIQIYAEQYQIIHTSYELECLCRLSFALLGFIIVTCYETISNLYIKFLKRIEREKSYKEALKNENK